MTDDLVKKLREDVFYGEERMHKMGKHNHLHMQAAARIAELEAECWRMKEERDRAIGWRDSDQARAEAAEAGLRVALKDAERIDRVWYDNYAALEANMIKVMEHVMDYSNDPHLVRFARATIAEIKETNHDT